MSKEIVIPGLTRDPSRRGAMPPWIAGQARNDNVLCPRAGGLAAGAVPGALAMSKEIVIPGLTRDPSRRGAMAPWIAGQARNDNVSCPRAGGFAAGAVPGAVAMSKEIVIPGLTRDPSRRGAMAPWIAGQARNDNVSCPRAGGLAAGAVPGAVAMSKEIVIPGLTRDPSRRGAMPPWIAGQARNDNVSCPRAGGFAAGAVPGAVAMSEEIVIPGLTRDPSRRGAMAPWIAGQARNDNASECHG